MQQRNMAKAFKEVFGGKIELWTASNSQIIVN
jgi:hypothetical protein